MTHNIDHRSTLLAQFDALKSFPMFEKMARTVEASPWHREANVLVHTEMVVDRYVQMVDYECEHFSEPWSRRDYLGGIAAVFHDTGKPDAEIEKWSEARGKYRAYHGHELLSARKFENYAAERFPMFTADEIFYVCWMIEHHMPWNLEDNTKLNNLAMTAKWLGATTFCRELLADQYGRLSDDKEAKDARSKAWVESFMERVNTVELPQNDDAHRQVAYFPIGPSGSGKSTYLKQLRESSSTKVEVFSLDLLRHEWYDAANYTKAYEAAVADKGFEARANARFHAIAKQARAEGSDLYIDNTNLSARRRKWYLDIVRKLGFQTTAVMMPIDLKTLLARQKTRGDKQVPDSAVKQQYYAMQSPMLGEFDEIVVSDHNMKGNK